MPRPTWPAGPRPTTLHQTPGPPSNEAGPPTPADGTALTSTPRVPVKPARKTREPRFTPHRRPEPTTPEKGGAEPLIRVDRHALDLVPREPEPGNRRSAQCRQVDTVQRADPKQRGGGQLSVRHDRT